VHAETGTIAIVWFAFALSAPVLVWLDDDVLTNITLATSHGYRVTRIARLFRNVETGTHIVSLKLIGSGQFDMVAVVGA